MDLTPSRFAQEYEIKKEIGKGRFGSVYLAYSTRYNSTFVIKKTKATPDAMKEAEIMSNLYSPYICNIYDYWADEESLYIVMNYCPNGTIQDYINKHGAIDICTFWTWSRQLLEALLLCQSNSIAHCDIKPANILIDKNNRVQISDFGLSINCAKTESRAVSRGTILTMSPEMLSKGYGPIDLLKSDIWSLGITFYIMLFGYSPYDSVCTL